jgi:hypothetical protein
MSRRNEIYMSHVLYLLGWLQEWRWMIAARIWLPYNIYELTTLQHVQIIMHGILKNMLDALFRLKKEKVSRETHRSIDWSLFLTVLASRVGNFKHMNMKLATSNTWMWSYWPSNEVRVELNERCASSLLTSGSLRQWWC